MKVCPHCRRKVTTSHYCSSASRQVDYHDTSISWLPLYMAIASSNSHSSDIGGGSSNYDSGSSYSSDSGSSYSGGDSGGGFSGGGDGGGGGGGF